MLVHQPAAPHDYKAKKLITHIGKPARQRMVWGERGGHKRLFVRSAAGASHTQLQLHHGTVMPKSQTSAAEPGTAASAGGFLKNILVNGWNIWTINSMGIKVFADEGQHLQAQQTVQNQQRHLTEAAALAATLRSKVSELQGQVHIASHEHTRETNFTVTFLREQQLELYVLAKTSMAGCKDQTHMRLGCSCFSSQLRALPFTMFLEFSEPAHPNPPAFATIPKMCGCCSWHAMSSAVTHVPDLPLGTLV